jgi:hypothetical protein
LVHCSSFVIPNVFDLFLGIENMFQKVGHVIRNFFDALINAVSLFPNVKELLERHELLEQVASLKKESNSFSLPLSRNSLKIQNQLLGTPASPKTGQRH